MMYKEKIWVEIETTKGLDKAMCYRGSIEKEDLDNWVAGKLNKKCIRLENTYWVADVVHSMPVYTVLGQTQGEFENMTGDVFMLVEHIVSISTLKDGSDLESEY